MICEDYPACGHTDGLGCDWVSPNEKVPCAVCIEARRVSPYHSRAQECPTLRDKAINDVPNGAVCAFCENEEADIMHGESAACYGCYEDARDYDRQMAEHYDLGFTFVSSEPYPGAWADAERLAYNYGLDD